MTSGQRPLARVRLLGSACALLALALSAATGWGNPTWWAVPLLVAAVAVTEVAVVHLQFGRQRWTFSLTEAALGAALVCAAGAYVVLAVALGVGVAQHLRCQPRIKLLYNVAQFSAAAALGAFVVQALGGGPVAVVLGLTAFWSLNYTLVASVVALTSDRPLRSLISYSAPLSAVHTAGNSSIGLLAAYLARNEPIGLLGLLVPLALLWISCDQQARRSAEASLFAELARGQERATARSTDVSAQVVLTAAARLFGSAEMEMVLLAVDGPVRYAADDSGTAQRLRVDQDAFDEPWVLRALGGGRVTAGTEGGRPWCAAVLGEPDAPLAVLIARRPAGSAGFGRNELRLAQVLAGQAETWLSVSDLTARHRAAAERVAAAGGAARALGDLGARTTPALTLLRDSAERLALLARSEAGVDDIVKELHLVERAVASLLGAIALAAEPDLLETGTAPGGSAPARPATDWTTTGVLS